MVMTINQFDADLLSKVKNKRVQVIDEPFTNIGIYVWELPSGKFFTDGEGNALSIESRRDDPIRMKEIEDAAAYYGEPLGKAVFFPNVRKISDEEYTEQIDRMAQGYIPSETDLGALIAAKKTLEAHGSYDD